MSRYYDCRVASHLTGRTLVHRYQTFDSPRYHHVPPPPPPEQPRYDPSRYDSGGRYALAGQPDSPRYDPPRYGYDSPRFGGLHGTDQRFRDGHLTGGGGSGRYRCDSPRSSRSRHHSQDSQRGNQPPETIGDWLKLLRLHKYSSQLSKYTVDEVSVGLAGTCCSHLSSICGKERVIAR